MTPQQIKIKTYFPVEVKLKMTKWELGFLTSLSKSNKEWSSRQKELLETLITKYELTAVPLPEKHIGMKRTHLFFLPLQLIAYPYDRFRNTPTVF